MNEELIALIEAYNSGRIEPGDKSWKAESDLERALLGCQKTPVVYKGFLYRYDTGLQHIIKTKVLVLG
ncbi:MAG: hypothetical protein WC824_11535 [Bacteroidota bacterium]|jgi:hypothetical protein